jgi:conjugative transfer region protein TrbK
MSVFRTLNWRAVARAATFLAAAGVIAAAGAWLGLSEVGSQARRLASVAAPVDPLAAVLRRCQVVAETGRDDPVCEAAWAENRRRFFTYSAAQPPYVKGR